MSLIPSGVPSSIHFPNETRHLPFQHHAGPGLPDIPVRSLAHTQGVNDVHEQGDFIPATIEGSNEWGDNYRPTAKEPPMNEQQLKILAAIQAANANPNADAASVAQRQDELPKSILLSSYNPPDRSPFPWNQWDPSKVGTAADLPPYLILGKLDPSSFQLSPTGWSALWQGIEPDTHFDVEYQADVGRFQLCQTWRGVGGGISNASFRVVPLDRHILQLLYMHFPSGWDR